MQKIAALPKDIETESKGTSLRIRQATEAIGQISETVNHVVVTIQDVNFIIGHINKIADELVENRNINMEVTSK